MSVYHNPDMVYGQITRNVHKLRVVIMSDLVLVLRSRLDEVTQWVNIGTEPMRDARKARGLSMESVSRLLHVSSKTYERWEKRGAVPRHEVLQVATALGLEIEEPARQPVSGLPEDVVLAALASVAARLDRIEVQLDELQSRPSVRRVAGSRRGAT